MKCSEVIRYIENWAPREIAWERDNVGLQVGSYDCKISNVLLSLDVTIDVVEQAVRKKCNLIISHHPLLFHSLQQINLSKDKISKIIETLIKNNITLFSVHTNLDFTKDGVSFELAKVLKLKDINFISSLNSNQYKLIAFVPESHLEIVANKIFEHGGGIIGEYKNCSFLTKGTGTFSGSEKTKPYKGRKNNFERVEEIRLEVLIDSWKLNEVIRAIKEVHPYEEIAYDVYPLKNDDTKYGVGALGYLEKDMTEKNFLDYVAKKLKIKNFRYTKGKSNKIKKVAVCGGSGSEFTKSSISFGADAFITADVKYHSFHDANKEILLIDAGHYETEIFSLNEIDRRLKMFLQENKGTRLPDRQVRIYKYTKSTNPIIFYNN